MDVSIIFVNWNSGQYLLECIRSIYQYTTGIAFEIIVFDNASPNPDLDEVEQEFPEITLLRSAKNLGFAGANNAAAAQAKGEYLLFLNPDTLLKGPAIETLLAHCRSLPNMGIAGCRLLNTDLTVQTSAIQKYPTILNQFFDLEYIQLRWPRCPLWDLGPLFSGDSSACKVESVSGACMMVEKAVFQKVGMFSTEYFMYAEDIDLCYRVAKMGLTNYFVPGAVIVHHGGRSSTQRGGSSWASVGKCRAMTLFCRKTRGRIYSAAFRAALGIAALCRVVLLAGILPLKARSRRPVDVMRKWLSILEWSVGMGQGAGSRS